MFLNIRIVVIKPGRPSRIYTRGGQIADIFIDLDTIARTKLA